MDPQDDTSKPGAKVEAETREDRTQRQHRVYDVTKPKAAPKRPGPGRMTVEEAAQKAVEVAHLALPMVPQAAAPVYFNGQEVVINEVSEQEAEVTDPNSLRKKVYLQGLRLINAIQLSPAYDLETKVKHSITAMGMISGKEVIVWDARNKPGRMEVEEMEQISTNLSTWLKRVPSKDKTEAVVAEALVALNAGGDKDSN